MCGDPGSKQFAFFHLWVMVQSKHLFEFVFFMYHLPLIFPNVYVYVLFTRVIVKRMQQKEPFHLLCQVNSDRECIILTTSNTKFLVCFYSNHKPTMGK